MKSKLTLRKNDKRPAVKVSYGKVDPEAKMLFAHKNVKAMASNDRRTKKSACVILAYISMAYLFLCAIALAVFGEKVYGKDISFQVAGSCAWTALHILVLANIAIALENVRRRRRLRWQWNKLSIILYIDVFVNVFILPFILFACISYFCKGTTIGGSGIGLLLLGACILSGLMMSAIPLCIAYIADLSKTLDVDWEVHANKKGYNESWTVVNTNESEHKPDVIDKESSGSKMQKIPAMDLGDLSSPGKNL